MRAGEGALWLAGALVGAAALACGVGSTGPLGSQDEGPGASSGPRDRPETAARVAACGNGVLDDGEFCDGALVPGHESCDALGLGSGTLGCHESCAGLDVSRCAGLPTKPEPVTLPCERCGPQEVCTAAGVCIPRCEPLVLSGAEYELPLDLTRVEVSGVVTTAGAALPAPSAGKGRGRVTFVNLETGAPRSFPLSRDPGAPARFEGELWPGYYQVHWTYTASQSDHEADQARFPRERVELAPRLLVRSQMAPMAWDLPAIVEVDGGVDDGGAFEDELYGARALTLRRLRSPDGDGGTEPLPDRRLEELTRASWSTRIELAPGGGFEAPTLLWAGRYDVHLSWPGEADLRGAGARIARGFEVAPGLGRMDLEIPVARVALDFLGLGHLEAAGIRELAVTFHPLSPEAVRQQMVIDDTSPGGWHDSEILVPPGPYEVMVGTANKLGEGSNALLRSTLYVPQGESNLVMKLPPLHRVTMRFDIVTGKPGYWAAGRSVTFVRRSDGEKFGAGFDWDGDVDSAHFSRTQDVFLPPGAYDVWFSMMLLEQKIHSGVSVPETQWLDVEVEAVAIEGTVRAGDGEHSIPQLYFVPSGGAETTGHGLVRPSSNLRSTYESILLPGTYDVYAGPTNRDHDRNLPTRFPIGDTLIRRDLEVVEDATIDLEVPVRETTVEVTLDGRPLPDHPSPRTDARGVVVLASGWPEFDLLYEQNPDIAFIYRGHEYLDFVRAQEVAPRGPVNLTLQHVAEPEYVRFQAQGPMLPQGLFWPVPYQPRVHLDLPGLVKLRLPPGLALPGEEDMPDEQALVIYFESLDQPGAGFECRFRSDGTTTEGADHCLGLEGRYRTRSWMLDDRWPSGARLLQQCR